MVIAACQAAGRNVAAVLDDDKSKHGTQIMDVSVVGGISTLEQLSHCEVILAIGDNASRKKLESQIKQKFATIVHPSAWVHESVQIDVGTVVMAGAVIQPDTKVGRHCIVNTRASIDHDSHIGDFAHIAPGVTLCGKVHVGEGSLVGVGACARPSTSIGDWCQIGAGAVVVSDIPSNSTAMGIPARATKSR